MSAVALPSSYVWGVVFETPCKALDAYGRRCVEGRKGEGDEDIKENNFILVCPHFDLSKKKLIG
jgi:hypothetical protein